MTYADDEHLFAEFESSLLRDLRGWRTILVNFRDDLLPEVFKAFVMDRGREPDLNNDEDLFDLSNVLLYVISPNWNNIEGSPKTGDIIVLKGQQWIQTYNESEKIFEGLLVDGGLELRGVLDSIGIERYVDPAVIPLIKDLDEEDRDDVPIINGYIRPFGVQLILKDIIIADSTDKEDPGLKMELAHIPLDYTEVDIAVDEFASIVDNTI